MQLGLVRVVRRRGRRGEERRCQRFRTDVGDQRFVAQAVGSDEPGEQPALDRLLDNLATGITGISHDDQRIAAGFRQGCQFRAVGVLLLLMLDFSHDFTAERLVSLDKCAADTNAIIIVHEGHGNLLDAFVKHHLGQDLALEVV